MNPFLPSASDQITESDLVAFHLRELSSRKERAILRAIESSPSLAAESDAIAASLNALKDVPMHINDTVLDRNWKAIRPALSTYIHPPLGAPWWRLPVFAGALVACAATLIFVAITRNPVHLPANQPASQATLPPTSHPLIKIPNQDGLSSLSPRFESSGGSGFVRVKPLRPHLALQSDLAEPVSSAASLPPSFAPQAEPVAPPTPFSAKAKVPSAIGSVQGLSSASDQKTVDRSERTWPHSLDTLHPRHSVDLLFAMGGSFLVPHTSGTAGTDQTTETASHAVAALAAVHQQFRRGLGYRVTVSYSRPDFSYSSQTDRVEINSRIYELTGTYVIEGPRRHRLTTSADVGAGVLAFLPTVASQFPGRVYRASGVVGVNVDYALTKHWGARASYRAQVYKSPDFSAPVNFIPPTNNFVISNEPSLGITYSFGKK